MILSEFFEEYVFLIDLLIINKSQPHIHQNNLKWLFLLLKLNLVENLAVLRDGMFKFSVSASSLHLYYVLFLIPHTHTHIYLLLLARSFSFSFIYKKSQLLANYRTQIFTFFFFLKKGINCLIVCFLWVNIVLQP